jgi:hypothetical protein
VKRWDGPRAWSVLAWVLWIVVFAALSLVFVFFAALPTISENCDPNCGGAFSDFLTDIAAPAAVVCILLGIACVIGAAHAAVTPTKPDPETDEAD